MHALANMLRRLADRLGPPQPLATAITVALGAAQGSAPGSGAILLRDSLREGSKPIPCQGGAGAIVPELESRPGLPPNERQGGS